MLIEVSNGEIIDKLTILEIKLFKIEDPIKRVNLKAEYEVLLEAYYKILSEHQGLKTDIVDIHDERLGTDIVDLHDELYEINANLWEIEDACRAHEAEGDFGESFIQIARSVYLTNDERATIKKEINKLTNSRLTEEKSYQ